MRRTLPAALLVVLLASSAAQAGRTYLSDDSQAVSGKPSMPSRPAADCAATPLEPSTQTMPNNRSSVRSGANGVATAGCRQDAPTGPSSGAEKTRR
jgi:hypothetical protein